MPLTPGSNLGRYEVADLIGAGGMGEVYRARDTRLGRDVAIKVLPKDVASAPERLRRFEHEARAVAALNHPNILTVFDVGTHDGTPYVVTELLEGETFRELLTRRAPTQQQVLAFAVQAAQGLAAAHRKGITHRDLKPENLFLTTDGRVKILDFGLARIAAAVSADTAGTTQEDLTRPGMLMGTVAYMSPEQAKALPVDPRSDVFSFGIVLYELLSRTHPFRRETMTATLTAILQETPPAPSTLDPEISPALDWVVMRCLEKTPDERFASAHELGLALEAVLKAPVGASWLTEVEERNPYPGLQSFTEKDARAFFGREEEVKALWQRIEHRGLLAVIGPSGAGKTSFVRAGVVASKPEGWGAIVCKPGAAPLRSLGQALAPELASDPEALRRLLSFDEPQTAFELIARWRRAKGDALLVVDQFEELFTLNAKATQELFAALLGRLASEAGVHVLLSLRDDFLIRCSDYEPLAPVFESLTPLSALTTDGLRRALVEPAKSLDYAFEDEALVTEMIASVEGVRGALPLLAFAVSRLWEKRDREKRLLTREAYEEVGGVAGALAQHAEAVMSRVGPERQVIVREIFRNLVTAHGTRAIVDRDEIMSAFPEKNDAYGVLRALIDARLLTSYEVEEAEGHPSRHRVEVAHESLLKAWPRLVKWQAQDEEGAVLRDQLKQAAHLWEEKSRTADLLWTGTAYREFELWRERYPGKLTAVESDFARAMSDSARRRKRLVRASVAAAFLALTGVAIAIGISRYQAVAQARRAEAGKLLALAQVELETDPTGALAYATKSLELSDTTEARLFALRVLQEAPTATRTPDTDVSNGLQFSTLDFSRNGEWLALGGLMKAQLRYRDGRERTILHGDYPITGFDTVFVGFGRESDALVTNKRGDVRMWSVPEGREVRTAQHEEGPSLLFMSGKGFITVTTVGAKEVVRRWPLPEGESRPIGTMDAISAAAVNATGSQLAYGHGRKIYLRSLDNWDLPPRFLAENPSDVSGVAFHPDGQSVAVIDRSEEIRIWATSGRPDRPLRLLEAKGCADIRYSPGGKWLVAACEVDGRGLMRLWDLTAPPVAEPLVLRSGRWFLGIGLTDLTFDPSEMWLATALCNHLAFWPLGEPYPLVLRGHKDSVWGLAFTPDGATLVSAGIDGLRAWPLTAHGPTQARTLLPMAEGMALDSTGRQIAVVGGGRVSVVPLEGGPARELEGFSERVVLGAVAFAPDGRRVAAAPYSGPAQEKVIRVWDLQSGAVQVLGPVPGAGDGFRAGIWSLSFLDQDRILAGCSSSTPGSSDFAGLLLFDLRTGKGSVLSKKPQRSIVISRTGRFGLGSDQGPSPTDFELVRFSLDGKAQTTLEAHRGAWAVAMDPTETLIASGSTDGTVRVGPLSGAEPHLFLGHKGAVYAVAFSPDGRWVASAGEDKTIRLWPVPDVTKTPPHKRSHEEFLATLLAWTNVRVVPDAKSATGWKLETGPFPGWQNVPTW